METKHCPRCEQTKSCEEFYRRSARSGGRQGWCKECHRDYIATRRSDPETIYADLAAARERRFGISPAAFEAMYLAQRQRCAACDDPIDRAGSNTHIDHCHATGVVRGILCGRCNRALGFMQDSAARVRGLLTYIEAHGG